jgi:hypothetical protein
MGRGTGEQMPLVEGEDALVIHLVHVLLVAIEPDRGPFGADRRCCRTALGRRAAGGERDRIVTGLATCITVLAAVIAVLIVAAAAVAFTIN